MNGWRVEPLRCPDCGQFVHEQGGIHDCPGPAICARETCGHESSQHLVVSTRTGRGWRYGPCASAFAPDGLGRCACPGFRRMKRGRP